MTAQLFWLDTEFWERPGHIDLISIGIVRYDGAEYYAENASFKWDLCRNDWLHANVKPHLDGRAAERGPQQIKADLLEFAPAAGQPEFWGYYADYDWVVFCWLFGAMGNLPLGYPMYCRDIRQWADMLGHPKLPEQASTEHHALADARWNREAWEFLRRLEAADGD